MRFHTTAAMILVLMTAGRASAQTDAAIPAVTPPVKTPADGQSAENAKRVLSVGDPAPPIAVSNWVKGDPVKEFEKGRVYVVEFWATWCPPCRESIPFLTKVAKSVKLATVMSIAASERKEKDGTDKRLDNLKEFVKKQGDKMGFRVGFDPDRSMAKQWMEAAERDQIPTAFIVGGDGKIAWIGHPMDMEKPLIEAVQAVKAEIKARQKSPGKTPPKPDSQTKNK
ncbi:MAG: TlpA family protein disulfide reductase [Phycisphaerae bacterium]|nr:TlpA family protein disulfide reductase [Phycisphaerae bacterium]